MPVEIFGCVAPAAAKNTTACPLPQVLGLRSAAELPSPDGGSCLLLGERRKVSGGMPERREPLSSKGVPKSGVATTSMVEREKPGEIVDLSGFFGGRWMVDRW